MSQQTITAGQSGAICRSKLNANFTELYALFYSEANTVYVRADGNDGTGVVGSRANPFLTLQGAVDQYVVDFPASDICVFDVGAGTFAGFALPPSIVYCSFRGAGRYQALIGAITSTSGDASSGQIYADIGRHSVTVASITLTADTGTTPNINAQGVIVSGNVTIVPFPDEVGCDVYLRGLTEIAGNVSVRGGNQPAADGDGQIGGDVQIIGPVLVSGTVDVRGGDPGIDSGSEGAPGTVSVYYGAAVGATNPDAATLGVGLVVQNAMANGVWKGVTATVNIADPAGAATDQDDEARTAIGLILDALEAAGIVLPV